MKYRRWNYCTIKNPIHRRKRLLNHKSSQIKCPPASLLLFDLYLTEDVNLTSIKIGFYRVAFYLTCRISFQITYFILCKNKCCIQPYIKEKSVDCSTTKFFLKKKRTFYEQCLRKSLSLQQRQKMSTMKNIQFDREKNNLFFSIKIKVSVFQWIVFIGKIN